MAGAVEPFPGPKRQNSRQVWNDSLCGADGDSRNEGWDMELKRTVIGTAIVAAGVLGGWWLSFQPVPSVQAGVQQRCIDMEHRVLGAAFVRLPEGVTLEDLEEMSVAFCACVARQAEKQLTQQNLAAIIRNQSTREVDGKLAAVYQQCSLRTH